MWTITVYLDNGKERKEVMRDVIHVEAEKNGFRLISSRGNEKHIEGKLKCADFWKELVFNAFTNKNINSL